MAIKFTRILFILLVVLNFCSCYQWPSNVKRCSLNDTNAVFNKCLTEATKNTIPLMAHGVKAWGIPPLNPFHMLSDMTLSNGRPPISLTFRIYNGTVFGPTDFKLHNARYESKRHEFVFEGLHKNLTMVGNYDLKGDIFNFNMKSKGIFRLEMHNVDEVFSAKIVPTKKRGFMDPKFNYKIKKLSFFNAWMRDSLLPPGLEKTFLEVVNRNWEQVVQAMIPTTERAFRNHFLLVLTPLFRRFPMSEIVLGFPDLGPKAAQRTPEGEVTETATDPSNSY